MQDHHFKNGIGSVHPSSHNDLQKVLSLQLSFLGSQLNLEGVEHLSNNVTLSRDNSLAKGVDWDHDELGEGSGEGVSLGVVVFVSPDFIWGIIKVVTPKLLHHFLFINSEFLGISFSKESQSETPTVLSGTEGDISPSWVQLDLSHIGIGVVLANDVGLLNNSLKRLVHILRLHAELNDGSVDLVDHEDWLDALLHSLSEDSLSLDADSFDAVDNDQGTVGDSEGSSDF
jgi:hypothetical protein